MEYAPIGEAVDVADLAQQVDLRLGEMAANFEADQIGIVVPRENTQSGEPLHLTVQDVLLPLMGQSSPTSSAKLIDAEAVLGGTQWVDLTDGGETTLHHHDARYVNVTGDSMTGALNMGSNNISAIARASFSTSGTDPYIEGGGTSDLYMVSGSTNVKVGPVRVTVTGSSTVHINTPALTATSASYMNFVSGDADTKLWVRFARGSTTDGLYLYAVAANDDGATGSVKGDVVFGIDSIQTMHFNVGSPGVAELKISNAQVTVTADLTFTGNVTMAEDKWIGITGPAERLVFNGSAGQIEVQSSNLFLAGTNKVIYNAATEYTASLAAGYVDRYAATAHRFYVGSDLVATVSDNTVTVSSILEVTGVYPVIFFARDASTGYASMAFYTGATSVVANRKWIWQLRADDEHLHLYDDIADTVMLSYQTGVGCLVAGTHKWQFNAATEYINSGAAGYMDYAAATAHRFETSLLYVDVTNGRIGIGTATPAQKLELEHAGTVEFLINNTSSGHQAFMKTDSTSVRMGAESNSPLHLRTNNLDRVTISSAGDGLVIGTAKWQFNDAGTYIASLADSYLDIVADGRVRINTNAWFEADGTRVASGAATTFNDLFVGFSSAKVPAANFPNWEPFDGNLNAFTFAVNDYLELDPVELEHTYDEDTDFYLHVHWATNGSEGAAKYVKWEIEYTIANSPATGSVGDTFPATTVVSAETEIPASTADLANMYTAVATITGTNFNIGAILKMRVRRIASAGTAPVADPFGLMVGVHIEQDTDGSRTEVTK